MNKLKNLLKNHHRCIKLKQRLVNGSDWKFIDLKQEIKVKDLEARLRKVNHKSEKTHEGFLVSALKKEIVRGWELLILLKKVK